MQEYVPKSLQQFRIYPTVVFGKDCRIGESVCVEDRCRIGNNVMLGNFVVLREGTIVGNDTTISHFATTEMGARIGNNVAIGVYGHITKDTVIEDWVFFGFGAACLNDKRLSYGRPRMIQNLEAPHIEFGARIGARSIIMPGVRIGREAFIGAGSLVTKDCEPFGMYVGRPARKIGEVPDEEKMEGC